MLSPAIVKGSCRRRGSFPDQTRILFSHAHNLMLHRCMRWCVVSEARKSYQDRMSPGPLSYRVSACGVCRRFLSSFCFIFRGKVFLLMLNSHIKPLQKSCSMVVRFDRLTSRSLEKYHRQLLSFLRDRCTNSGGSVGSTIWMFNLDAGEFKGTT